MIKVSARAPTRIDLAGGTLDLWPIHQVLDHKATVNVGVTLEAQVDVVSADDDRFRFVSQDQGQSFTGTYQMACQTRELPLIGLLLAALWHERLPALTITTAAKSPAGAGLGGSSCLGIALAAALWRARQVVEDVPTLGEHDLVRVVRDVESRLIHSPAGIQDYWGAVRGRVNVLRFPPGTVDVQTLAPAAVHGLSEELTLCFSGKSRQSAINNWEIFKRVFDGDRQLLRTFNEIGALAEQCAEAVRDGDLPRLLSLSQKEWQLRTRLWPNIETDETKRLDKAACAAGARFSRVCGAGGGGVMAVFAPPGRREAVRAALTEHGGLVLNATVAACGLTVEAASR
jgi:D-glycero-alpha-D-manno-heptose-7-phosphate kinase